MCGSASARDAVAASRSKSESTLSAPPQSSSASPCMEYQRSSAVSFSTAKSVFAVSMEMIDECSGADGSSLSSTGLCEASRVFSYLLIGFNLRGLSVPTIDLPAGVQSGTRERPLAVQKHATKMSATPLQRLDRKPTCARRWH